MPRRAFLTVRLLPTTMTPFFVKINIAQLYGQAFKGDQELSTTLMVQRLSEIAILTGPESRLPVWPAQTFLTPERCPQASGHRALVFIHPIRRTLRTHLSCVTKIDSSCQQARSQGISTHMKCSTKMSPLLLGLALSITLTSAAAPAPTESLANLPLVKAANKLARLEAEQVQTARIWRITMIWLRMFYSSEKKPLDEKFELPDRFMELRAKEREQLRARFPKISQLEKLLGQNEFLTIGKRISDLEASVKKLQVEDRRDLVLRAVREFHEGKLNLEFDSLDYLFGIDYAASENAIDKTKYPETLFGNTKANTQSPYGVIKTFFSELELKGGDIMYDLGSGYGRTMLYGGILFPKVQFRGIEIVAERAAASQKISEQLLLSNVKFIANDVLLEDLSQGKVFFLFNPFPSIMEKVMKRLQAVAKIHPITIVASGLTSTELRSQTWLKMQNPEKSARTHLTIFVSI